LSLFDPLKTDPSELRDQLEEAAGKAGIFFKPRFGLKAQGAGRLSCSGKDRWSLKIGSEDTIQVTWEQLFKKLSSIKKPLIFQENLTNHPMLAEFSTSALNIIRLSTYRSSGDLHVLEAKFKLGERGSIADTRGLGARLIF